MVSRTFEEPDGGGLPASLRELLDAFPVDAIRDEPDRLAAVAEALNQVSGVLDGMGIAGEERRRLLDRYLKALYARLEAAGRWLPRQERPQFGIVTVARPRGMPPPAFRVLRWLRSRIGEPTRVCVYNRRVDWRRRKWRRLLAD